MQNFRNLKVWNRAHELTLAVYREPASFPKEELYGLTSQMRRSSSSISSNIAEGCGSRTGRDLARFLQIALGSSSELEYQLLLSHDLGFIDADQHGQLTDSAIEVKRMLTSFIKRLTTVN